MTNVYECEDPMVNPNHYKTKSGLETIEVIEAFTDGLNGIEAVDVGHILRYITRYKKKNGIQDVQKALWYCNHLLKYLEKQDKEVQYNENIKNKIDTEEDIIYEG